MKDNIIVDLRRILGDINQLIDLDLSILPINELKSIWNGLSDSITKLEQLISTSSDYRRVDASVRLPNTYETGNWDGKRSDIYHIICSSGILTGARLYSGFMDGSEFNDWYSVDDYEVDVEYWLEPTPTKTEKTHGRMKEVGMDEQQRQLDEIEQSAEDMISIPKWQMKHIEDTLRLTNNIHHSQNKETCHDRQVCKAWDWVKESLASQTKNK